MEIYTPEAVLSLMSSLIPALSRPPFSQSTLDKVLIWWRQFFYPFCVIFTSVRALEFLQLFFRSWVPCARGWSRWADIWSETTLMLSIDCRQVCAHNLKSSSLSQAPSEMWFQTHVVEIPVWKRQSVWICLNLCNCAGVADKPLPRLEPGDCAEASTVGGKLLALSTSLNSDVQGGFFLTQPLPPP